MIEKRLLNVEEVAQFLGRTPGAVRALINRGVLPVIRLDRRIQFDVNDLEALIQKMKTREKD